MVERLGDAPIEPQHVEVMKALAHGIDEILNGPDPGEPKQNGFVLLVFAFGGHEGRCNYISNANRADIVVLLREQLARFEGMPEATGRG